MKTEEASMRDLVSAVGGALRPGENRKSWLARVAEAAGISPRVASAAYYGETAAAGVAEKLRKAAGKDAAEHLARQFDELARALDVRDSDFHRADIGALIDAARALRGLHRPRDTGSGT